MPIVINFTCVAFTAKICNHLNAIVNLDIRVVKTVLEDMEDMHILKAQLRNKMLQQMSSADEQGRQEV